MYTCIYKRETLRKQSKKDFQLLQLHLFVPPPEIFLLFISCLFQISGCILRKYEFNINTLLNLSRNFMSLHLPMFSFVSFSRFYFQNFFTNVLYIFLLGCFSFFVIVNGFLLSCSSNYLTFTHTKVINLY